MTFCSWNEPCWLILITEIRVTCRIIQDFSFVKSFFKTMLLARSTKNIFSYISFAHFHFLLVFVILWSIFTYKSVKKKVGRQGCKKQWSYKVRNIYCISTETRPIAKWCTMYWACWIGNTFGMSWKCTFIGHFVNYHSLIFQMAPIVHLACILLHHMSLQSYVSSVCGKIQFTTSTHLPFV